MSAEDMVRPKQLRSELSYRTLAPAQRADADRALIDAVKVHFAHGAVEGIAPKLVVVLIGTNNTGHRMDDAADTAAGVERIVKELKKRLPETKVLLLGIFPRAEKARAIMRKRNDEINHLISRFADDRTVFYININDAFLDGQGNLSREIMPDLLHPNTRGYELWAEAMEPKIKELMGED